MNGMFSKAARGALEMTRFEVAREVGFSPEIIRNFERGLSVLKSENHKKLIEFYNSKGFFFESTADDKVYKISMIFPRDIDSNPESDKEDQ